MTLILAFLTPAFAVDHEIDVEAGWLNAPDSGWSRFSERPSLMTIGVRGGFALTDRLALVAGWQHGGDGVSVTTDGYEYDYDYDYDYGDDTSGSTFTSAFTGEQFTLGAKVDIEPFPWFRPYVAAQGALLVATARFDEDLSTDDNVTQRRETGLTGGFVASLGLEFPIAVVDGLAIAPYAEGGYAWYAPVALSDVGSLSFHGFSGRAGVGLRF